MRKLEKRKGKKINNASFIESMDQTTSGLEMNKRESKNNRNRTGGLLWGVECPAVMKPQVSH